MKEIHTLFGGEVRVKMIRYFLFNPTQPYSLPMLQDRLEVPLSVVQKEITILANAGLIRKKYAVAMSGGKRARKAKMPHWHLNPTFPYSDALHTFFSSTVEFDDKHLLSKVSRIGLIKLVVITGALVKSWESKIDLLIVGDEVRQGALTKALKTMEADMGRELRVALLTTADFKYRIGVYDRLIRDVLDNPHKVLLDKVGLPENIRPHSLSTSIGVPF